MGLTIKVPPPDVAEHNYDWVGIPRGMTREIAELLAALQNAGEDDTPRLLLADAFQEAGYDPEAAFIRRQVEDIRREPIYNGVRQTSPVYWSAPELEEGGPSRVTIEGLLAVKPWECRQWYTTADTKWPRNVAQIQIASAATRRKGPTVYPAVTWHRGFLHSIYQISPQALFRYVESGAHAWHPWSYGKADSEAGEVYLNYLQSFTTTAFPFSDPHGYYWRISYRDKLNASGRSAWHSGNYRPNAAGVVPYPIACFMGRGPTIRGEPRQWEIRYRHSTDAMTDLHGAMRRFVHTAAHRARYHVTERGGTL